MIDISKDKALRQYLLEKGIIQGPEEYSFHYCKGGVSCTVALVHIGERIIILKQGLAKLRVQEEWECDPNRMYIEQRCNQIYHQFVPECAPEVYFYDEENYIYGREAVPEDWHTWKEELIQGVLNFNISEQAISALVTVHNHCAGNTEIQREFWNKDIFYSLRVSPYIEFIVSKYPQLQSRATEVIQLLMDNAITLVHGDFSPKNIMTDGTKIQILDYEVAHFGHPAFDLAFFSTHFILKAIKNKQWSSAYMNMLECMLDAYFFKEQYMDSRKLRKDFLQILPFMILARVDGKSPAEYIKEQVDKDRLRTIAFQLMDHPLSEYQDAISIISNINGGI